ncbi:MAG: pantoate--beta-alanine ligase [Halomonadaceae bacterium]|nr:MAG: pantoate--beta-alanine ligase [Halomonadaceae bacterium]
MRTTHTINELKAYLQHHRNRGHRIALVPTMGNLHQGHLALVKAARQQADVVVTSIFVNPLQFGANEDLDSYPRTLAEDQRLLNETGNDLVFAPSPREMYPNGLDQHTRVTVPVITELHCGANRPGHFTGVATVVTLLFNIVQPDVAVFGEKDFQQLAVIRKLAQDLCLPVHVESMPTYREADGLAMSSRNRYLSPQERSKAVLIYQMLEATAEHIRKGRRDYTALTDQAVRSLAEQGFKPDYFNIVNSQTLAPAEYTDLQVTLLAAAWLGNTRLIDNISVDLKDASNH